ncbi:hypothetical protein ASF70_12985 [Rhizobium sp. Leaf321]|nr:hypothetical protein ASF70_12985 [Rhizobium sp. Leaf321]
MLDGFMLLNTDSEERPTKSISIEDQLRAIQAVIRANERADTSLSAEIDELASLPSHTERDEDEYIFLRQQSTYMGSAMSLTVAALYVSFVETLITTFIQKIGADYGPQHRRINPSYARWKKDQTNHFQIKKRGNWELRSKSRRMSGLSSIRRRWKCSICFVSTATA